MNRAALSVRSAARFVGARTRKYLRFPLMLIGASWGVVCDAVKPTSWRRTVRDAFGDSLRQAVGGGLFSTLFIAALAGLGLVAQAVYWLGLAGMATTTNKILVTVLVREIAPLLVGVILLGRSGMVGLAEVGQMTIDGKLRTLQAQGIDPFLMLVMPRVLAVTVSSFTLGIIFGATSLSVGYAFCRAQSIITMPLWTFLYGIVGAMEPLDYVSIPLKLVLSGFWLSLATLLTGLDAARFDDLSHLLPLGFARGMLVVLIVTVAVDVTV